MNSQPDDQKLGCTELIAAMEATDKGLAIAIIRRSEAALQYNALIRSSSSSGGTAASQLAEFYWSPSTHKFYDNTSTEGFETVLHAAARLTRLGSKRATGYSTRQATTKLFHLPIEIWYHVLSFLTRSDLDHAATVRDRGLVQTAAVNDIFAYTYPTNGRIVGVDVCPLKHAILGSFVGKTWDCYEQVAQVLVNAPSAHDGSKEHKECSECTLGREKHTLTTSQIIEINAKLSARIDDRKSYHADYTGDHGLSKLTKVLMQRLTQDGQKRVMEEFADFKRAWKLDFSDSESEAAHNAYCEEDEFYEMDRGPCFNCDGEDSYGECCYCSHY